MESEYDKSLIREDEGALSEEAIPELSELSYEPLTELESAELFSRIMAGLNAEGEKESEGIKPKKPLFFTLRRYSVLAAALVVGVFGALIIGDGFKGMDMGALEEATPTEAYDAGSGAEAEEYEYIEEAALSEDSDEDEEEAAPEASEEELETDELALPEDDNAPAGGSELRTEEIYGTMLSNDSEKSMADEAPVLFAQGSSGEESVTEESAADEEEYESVNEAAGSAPLVVTASDVSQKLGWHDFEILNVYFEEESGKTVVLLRVYDMSVAGDGSGGKDISYYYENGVFVLK